MPARLSQRQALLKLQSRICNPLVPRVLPAAKQACSRSLRSGAIVASASQSGTVKMVVQGRQIELTPSIKQYAEEKVNTLTQLDCELSSRKVSFDPSSSAPSRV